MYDLNEKDQFCFDQPDAQVLLKRAREAPILEQELQVCQERVTNLEAQGTANSELLQIAEERRKLQEERVAFYKEMAEAERKLNEGYRSMIETYEKKAKQEKVKNIFQIIGGAIIGVLLGLAL